MIKEIAKTAGITIGLSSLIIVSTFMVLGCMGRIVDKSNRKAIANEATMTREEAHEFVREIMEPLKESI